MAAVILDKWFARSRIRDNGELIQVRIPVHLWIVSQETHLFQSSMPYLVCYYMGRYKDAERHFFLKTFTRIKFSHDVDLT